MSPRAAGAGGLEDLLRLDPAGVHDGADLLERAAAGLRLAADLLGGGRPGRQAQEWSGEAATAAWTRLGERSAAASRGAEAFEDAARALRSHALALGTVLARAAALRERHTGAEAPEQGALALAAAALWEEVSRSGATAARTLATAASAAPAPTGWHRSSGEVVERWLTSALFGAGEAVAGVAALPVAALGLSAVRRAVDPAGHAAAEAAVASALTAAREDPLTAAAAVIDVEMWRSDPARATGRILPELVAVAVGGGGAAAVARGSSGVRAGAAASAVGRRGAERAAPGSSGWSDGGQLVLDPVQDAETRALLSRAEAVEPRVSAAIAAVRDRVGAVPEGMQHRLKELESLRRKVSESLGTGASLVEVVDGLGDTLRYTFTFDDARYAAGSIAALHALRREGFVPVKVKNAWGQERPYRGVNTTWGAPGSSILLEVQAHTPASWAANKATRDAYEVERLSSTPPQRRAAAHEEQRRVWSQVPTPPGVERVDAALVGLREASRAEVAGAGAPALAAAPLLVVPHGPPVPEPPPRHRDHCPVVGSGAGGDSMRG